MAAGKKSRPAKPQSQRGPCCVLTPGHCFTVLGKPVVQPKNRWKYGETGAYKDGDVCPAYQCKLAAGVNQTKTGGQKKAPTPATAPDDDEAQLCPISVNQILGHRLSTDGQANQTPDDAALRGEVPPELFVAEWLVIGQFYRPKHQNAESFLARRWVGQEVLIALVGGQRFADESQAYMSIIVGLGQSGINAAAEAAAAAAAAAAPAPAAARSSRARGAASEEDDDVEDDDEEEEEEEEEDDEEEDDDEGEEGEEGEEGAAAASMPRAVRHNRAVLRHRLSVHMGVERLSVSGRRCILSRLRGVKQSVFSIWRGTAKNKAGVTEARLRMVDRVIAGYLASLDESPAPAPAPVPAPAPARAPAPAPAPAPASTCRPAPAPAPAGGSNGSQGKQPRKPAQQTSARPAPAPSPAPAPAPSRPRPSRPGIPGAQLPPRAESDELLQSFGADDKTVLQDILDLPIGETFGLQGSTRCLRPINPSDHQTHQTSEPSDPQRASAAGGARQTRLPKALPSASCLRHTSICCLCARMPGFSSCTRQARRHPKTCF